jgi:hypothetical protein
MSLDVIHMKFKHPFTALVAGPTGSGKTVLVRRFLKNHSTLFHNIQNVKVLWCYGIWQKLYEEKIKGVYITYIAGLPSEADIMNGKPNVLVIDDLMADIGNDTKVLNLFTKGSHHYGISVFFLVQNVFHQARHMRDISLNSSYLILLKNPRDQQQIRTLALQLYPKDYRYFLEAYDDATKHEYGYLVVDLKPDTPDQYRLRSRLTHEERFPLSPVVYVKK